MKSLNVTVHDPETNAEFKGQIKQAEGNPDADVFKPNEEDRWQLQKRNYNELRLVDFISATDFKEVMLGRRDASSILRAAIDASWQAIRTQYDEWTPAEGVNYPTWPTGTNNQVAWPASSAAKGIPIRLPNATLLIKEQIELPQCVSLIGAAFSSSRLRFEEHGQIVVLGDMDTPFGPYMGLHGEISKVNFVPTTRTPIVLKGNLSNFRITNNHFSSVNLWLYDAGMIEHQSGFVRDLTSSGHPESDPTKGAAMRTRYGTLRVLRYGADTSKELHIEGNQFEGGLFAIKLSGAFNFNISNNHILYANLGIELRNCKSGRVNGNNIAGTAEGEPIRPPHKQGGLIAGGSDISMFGNVFKDLDLGCAIAGDNERPHFNAWIRCKAGNRSYTAIIDRETWRSPADFGTVLKNARAPFAG